MRRRSQSGVCRPSPVGGIVAGPKSFPAEIRDFIVLEPGRGQHIVGNEELALVPLIRSVADFATAAPTSKRRVRLDREAVERKVHWLQLDRAREISFPGSLDA